MNEKSESVNILIISCYLRDRLEYLENNSKEYLIFDDAPWFVHYMDESVRNRINPMNVNAYKSSDFPSVENISGIIIGGSEYMLSSGIDPWVDRLMAYIDTAAKKNTPMLGVCFGHQLIGKTFGAAVENRSPREFGTVSVTLSEQGKQDKLFKGLNNPLDVLMAHSDVVEKLTPDINTLAFNDYTHNQAIAIGDSIRGVQFHPEFSVEIMKAIHLSRKEDASDKHVKPKAAENKIIDTPVARMVLTNFIKYFVLEPDK